MQVPAGLPATGKGKRAWRSSRGRHRVGTGGGFAPEQVGAQLLTRDAGIFLDDRAQLGGERHVVLQPVVDRGLTLAHKPAEGALRAFRPYRARQWRVLVVLDAHGRKANGMPLDVNRHVGMGIYRRVGRLPS